MTKFEERESSNYIDGRYFSGWLGTTKVCVALSEDRELPYWIYFSAEIASGEAQAFDAMLRTALRDSVLRLAGVASFGRHEEVRVEY